MVDRLNPSAFRATKIGLDSFGTGGIVNLVKQDGWHRTMEAKNRIELIRGIVLLIFGPLIGFGLLVLGIAFVEQRGFHLQASGVTPDLGWHSLDFWLIMISALFGCLGAGAIAIGLIWIVHALMRHFLPSVCDDSDSCPKCGYKLKGSDRKKFAPAMVPTSAPCPKCGVILSWSKRPYWTMMVGLLIALLQMVWLAWLPNETTLQALSLLIPMAIILAGAFRLKLEVHKRSNDAA